MSHAAPPAPPPGVSRPAPRRPVAWLEPVLAPWKRRVLLANLSGRELSQRYKGSALGLLWALAGPLLQLAVYAVVFGWLLSARFGDAGDRAMYVLELFCGILLFGIFAEVISRAPTLVMDKQSLVTKVAFPLELLPLVAFWAALVPAVLGMGLLVGGVWYVTGRVPWTAPLVVLPLIPLLLLTTGLSWILSAVGVYVRDTQHAIRSAVQLLFFLTPVVWPISMLSDEMRFWVMLNPMAQVVEWSRAVLIHGTIPDAGALLVLTVACLAVCLVGSWCFQVLRRGFADVV
ncbi:MAG: ABC transporter permease [Phycisphaerales bacterium]|nr:MAG: ABC transporter permease [Phycisphaerales bacterium]